MSTAQGNPNVDLKTVLAWKPAPQKVSYTARDTILYNLGVGAKDLSYVYERDAGFRALPTLFCAMSFKGDSTGMKDFNATSGSFPGLKMDPANLLHGEEYVELLVDSLPVAGNFTQQSRVVDFLDKGKGGVLVMEQTFVDNTTQQPVCRIVRSSFLRGMGGHGGNKKLLKDPRAGLPAIPNRAPDNVTVETVPADQAKLYRLAGDSNPLHIDPAIAPMVGFKAPILHGLCTFGFSVRAVVAAYGGAPVRVVGCRFSSPVYPGDVLETRMWKEGPGLVLFDVRVGTTTVLSDGVCRFQHAAKL